MSAGFCVQTAIPDYYLVAVGTSVRRAYNYGIFGRDPKRETGTGRKGTC